MVDTMWKDFADVSTHSNSIFRSRKDNHKIWYCGNGLLQVSRDCDVDLVEAGDKVELSTISELVSRNCALGLVQLTLNLCDNATRLLLHTAMRGGSLSVSGGSTAPSAISRICRASVHVKSPSGSGYYCNQ